jgi:hypothetical protein
VSDKRVRYFKSHVAAARSDHGFGLSHHPPHGWLVKGALDNVCFDEAGTLWLIGEVAAQVVEK